MNIILKGTELDLTPSLKTYINQKLGALTKLVQAFDKEGAATLRVEVSRTTRHHRHGQIFRAEANLKLPQAMLRAVHADEDLRTAIDQIRNALKLEIGKYKTRHSPKAAARTKKGAKGR